MTNRMKILRNKECDENKKLTLGITLTSREFIFKKVQVSQG